MWLLAVIRPFLMVNGWQWSFHRACVVAQAARVWCESCRCSRTLLPVLSQHGERRVLPYGGLSVTDLVKQLNGIEGCEDCVESCVLVR
jgi:hypothetical protein